MSIVSRNVFLQTNWRVVLTCTTLASSLAVFTKYFIFWFKKCKLQKQRDLYKALMKECLQRVQLECQDAVEISVADEIAALKFDELKHKLQNGELSCVEVLYAYQRKALIENEKYNFIAQPIEEARDLALYLDTLSPEVKAKLPLYGIPVSFKENFHIKGYTATIGCSNLIDTVVNSTSPLYQSLVRAGAVPFIRTNIAQTMKSFGAHNPIYGQTRNPLDISRSPGGSSCGEAAAVASGSSVLGFGTDIGGSVRVPAAWTGIYSLKPTGSRISTSRMSKITYGQTAVSGASGVMARSMDAVVELMKTLSTNIQYDVDMTVLQKPGLQNRNPEIDIHLEQPGNSPISDSLLLWIEQYLSNRCLRVAYFLNWTSIPVTESAKSAVIHTVAELASQGHTVFEWQPPTVTGLDPAKLLLTSTFADGGHQIKQTLYGDDNSYIIRPLMNALSRPQWINRWLAKVLWRFIPSWYVFKTFLAPAGLQSPHDWFGHVNDVDTYKKSWLDEWMNTRIDVLITPVVPVPAEIIDEVTGCASGCGTFTYLFNLVDFPAGVVPCGQITPEQELYDLEMYPEHNSMLKKLKQSIPGCAGLPLSVQVIAAPFKEELCLRVMNLVDKLDKTEQFSCK